MSGSGRLPSPPAHGHRARSSITRASSHRLDQGIGAVSKSVLRSIGSRVGRWALKTYRNTLPDTVLVPSEPTSVTLTSRPETPRWVRSRAVSAPTFVRGSAPNHADSWARLYVTVCHVAKGAASS